ncbi:MAG TPA: hypothetical protein VG452_05805 [Egibacteraceae bacterium]|nr:hypothetical protein [Egibacteraceae bacterium]
MPVQAWDSGFVRARRRDVHPFLRDVAGYERWWPGVATRPDGDAVALTLRPPGLRRRPQRLRARQAAERADRGVNLAYRGDLEGEAEWYYLDEPAGVVVHYLLRAHTRPRGARRRLRDHRAAVRVALDALKDRLEAGRVPGAEPDPRLLADQRRATAASPGAADASPGAADATPGARSTPTAAAPPPPQDP